MSFISDDYIPKPNNWFSPHLSYNGWGHAEFLNPVGWVEGYVVVKVAETGKVSISMTVEDFHVEPSLNTNFRRNDLMWLIEGRKPALMGDLVMFASGVEPHNTCTKLTVWAEDGIFETIGDIRYYRNIFDDNQRLTFFCLYSGFEIYNAQPEKYWVLPLLNFVSEIAIRYPALGTHPLDRHPLRIFPTPLVPDRVKDHEERGHAFAVANSCNAIIAFTFNDCLGFIERLSDYAARKDKLISGSANISITALMVGETVGNGSTFDEALQWIPLDFLHLLSLATGSLIGTPWIEFRSTDGNLVRRIHTSQWEFPYHKGHEALDLFVTGGIGWLLSQAPTPLDPTLRVAINQTVKGAQDVFYLEDKLAYFFRALDTLCEGYDFYDVTKPKDVLSIAHQTKLSSAIKGATKAINELIKELKGSSDSATNARIAFLERVSQQISGAKNVRPGFGQAICALIRSHGFPDVEIVENHYEGNPRSDKKKWHEVLSAYRGTSIHRSYFMFSDNSTDIEDLVRIMRHVHDILLRIILKRVNYDGDYKRAIAIKERVSVEWVLPDTTADQLGYSVSLR